jgi:hypothetical protein
MRDPAADKGCAGQPGLEGLACVAAARQQPQRAAVLLGAAESIRKRLDASPPQERVDVDWATDAAVSALGREAFTGALERSGD